MTDDLTPGKRIKQVRESMGLTQQQFANLIAITQPSLARI
jgi:transcriptional regulator with XRE-family HTH domain